MTRRLPIYTAARLRDVIATQREVNPGCHDELIADLCAEVLTNGQGDDLAREDASRQVLKWLARAHVEGGA